MSPVMWTCHAKGWVHAGDPQRRHGPHLPRSKISAESRAWVQFDKEGACSGHQGHVALTSMMWSSVAGSTRTCCVWMWLNTCPGLKGSRRGMATPLCCWSPLPTECTLPRLRMLAVSPPSSRALSSRDRLSFSTQLSEDGKRQTKILSVHRSSGDNTIHFTIFFSFFVLSLSGDTLINGLQLLLSQLLLYYLLLFNTQLTKTQYSTWMTVRLCSD